MALMFVMSTDLGSGAHTSRIIEPILHWLNPEISAESVGSVQFFVRKAGHVSEYLVLCLLALRAIRSSLFVSRGSWSWRAAGLALLLSGVYAVSDEFHQSFVPSRGASPRDVAIDVSGATLGLTLAYLFRRSRPPQHGETTSPAGALKTE
jgi:VanZ family protein